MRTTFKLCLGAKSREREREKKEKGKTLNNHNHPHSQFSDSDSSSFTHSRLTNPSINKTKRWKIARNASKKPIFKKKRRQTASWNLEEWQNMLTHPDQKKKSQHFESHFTNTCQTDQKEADAMPEKVSTSKADFNSVLTERNNEWYSVWWLSRTSLTSWPSELSE